MSSSFNKKASEALAIVFSIFSVSVFPFLLLVVVVGENFFVLEKKQSFSQFSSLPTPSSYELNPN